MMVDRHNPRPEVLTGLDVIGRDGLTLPGQGRVGLLCNHATLDRRYRGTPEILQQLSGVQLVRIFSPQHGFAGEKQDNMVESGDGIHEGTGVPLISLYGRTREPKTTWLTDLDALIIDLPDVGTRVYTFLSTALLCLKACAAIGIPVVVLDRPNPIGGTTIEGPRLQDQFKSFVGLIPVPLRHGLTVGEYCRFGAIALGLGIDLRVIPIEGWKRCQHLPQTDLPWIMPSPNLPTWEGALAYPGMVLLEGTNLSEGRGTTRPFELFGAPWLDPQMVLASLRENGYDSKIHGFLLRQIAFQPTFHKFARETVRGFQLHVLDAASFRPVSAAVRLLSAVRACHPQDFAWKLPPYEYETEKMPIDLISGTDLLRTAIDRRSDPSSIIESWGDEEERFDSERAPFLLYN